VGPQAQELNVTPLPLLFHAGGKAKLMAETPHLIDHITATAHILSSYSLWMQSLSPRTACPYNLLHPFVIPSSN
jgi:hypothetical protein